MLLYTVRTFLPALGGAIAQLALQNYFLQFEAGVKIVNLYLPHILGQFNKWKNYNYIELNSKEDVP